MNLDDRGVGSLLSLRVCFVSSVTQSHSLCFSERRNRTLASNPHFALIKHKQIQGCSLEDLFCRQQGASLAGQAADETADEGGEKGRPVSETPRFFGLFVFK